MATTFEVIVAGKETDYARQAAAAVFAEIDAIEKALSRFVESSDISQVNHAEPGQWVRVTVHAIECLKVAARVNADTGGAFDVTIGSLIARWRNPDKSPRGPTDEELARARACVGMRLVEFDEKELRVRTKTKGVQLDLGGIGKGYAVDCAAEILAEWGVKPVLINAGGSTALAVGSPPGKEGWPVGVGGSGKGSQTPYRIDLRDKALSGSGVQEKGQHILDPRTGRPCADKTAAWSLCPSATLADALSTAFMVMTPAEVDRYCRAHPDTSALLLLEGKNDLLRYGEWKLIAAEPGKS
jgi:thiamine biosynthesis lipoprotein